MSTLYDIRSGTLVKSTLYTNGLHLKDSIAFNPLSLFTNGGQGVWYDPSDKSTLFQDVAGTVPVTKDGDPVALMRDKSVNGNHAAQTVSASRPIYKTDGTLHWLEFDGVDDNLQMKNAINLNMGEVFLSLMSNYSSVQALLSSGAPEYLGALKQAIWIQGASPDLYFNIPSVFAQVNDKAISIKINSTGDSEITAYNSTQVYTSSSITKITGLSSTKTLGAFSNTGATAYNGKVFGVVLIDGHVSTASRIDTINYLASKRG